MSRRPGTPRLLRQLNDRAALELLLTSGPLTRTQLGRETGLSKVTASQLLSRLEERGLVRVAGSQAGGRGPNAALYEAVPSSAYAVALEVGAAEATAAVADITGAVVEQGTIDPSSASDPVGAVCSLVAKLVESAGVPPERLNACVIGTPGVVDPRTGAVRFSFDLHAWLEGVFDALGAELGRPVLIENDVNLAAMAEHAEGAARDERDFALMWLSGGVGMAIMLDGRIRSGRSGGAGEIGYLPVPGAPLPRDVGRPGGFQSLRMQDGGIEHGFQSLVGGREIVALAAEHGVTGAGAAEVITAARDAAAEDPGGRGAAFLDRLAERIGRGVAAVCVVLDPGLVVLGGEVARAGGEELARRVAEAVPAIGPNAPEVGVGRVEEPVLRGALLLALENAREELYAAVAE
ncbi:ROK family transcriptional regulator [Nocardiopsis halophila]|uniref:ROK family transcriptional regulator n=1 Tax=Nocardiopsis halophila TaxID=141692 RepID=UPI0003474F0E|nr:ROK family transcriptional regulator [Nocardiopsis halophila]